MIEAEQVTKGAKIMFYFLNISFLLIYALMYAVFRQGLSAANNISRKTKFKGVKNYWWFEQAKTCGNLGKVYFVNKVFTIFYLFVAMAVIILGLFDFAKIIIISLIAVLGAMLIPMNFYAWINNNKKEFGKAFVLLRRRKDGTGTYDSSVVDVLWSVFPVFIVIVEVVGFL